MSCSARVNLQDPSHYPDVAFSLACKISLTLISVQKYLEYLATPSQTIRHRLLFEVKSLLIHEVLHLHLLLMLQRHFLLQELLRVPLSFSSSKLDSRVLFSFFFFAYCPGCFNPINVTWFLLRQSSTQSVFITLVSLARISVQ